jgi:putative oxidoreductase
MSRRQLEKRIDVGLLLLRVGIGLTFTLAYGLSKVKGGPPMWALLGGAFGRLTGVTFFPEFWGFMATLAEFGGGLCLALGILFRPACSLMLFTMIVAFASNIRGGYGFSSGASQAFVFAVVLLSLFITGAGRLTMLNAIRSLNKSNHPDTQDESRAELLRESKSNEQDVTCISDR